MTIDIQDEDVKMPLSVLVAICAEINNSKPAQMAAARLWINLNRGFRELLWEAAMRIPDEDTRDWIWEEIDGDPVFPSEPPTFDE